MTMPGKADPEHTVERTKPRPWLIPPQDRHLLAKSDIFQLQPCAAQNDVADERDQDHDDRLHAADGSSGGLKCQDFRGRRGFEERQGHPDTIPLSRQCSPTLEKTSKSDLLQPVAPHNGIHHGVRA